MGSYTLFRFLNTGGGPQQNNDSDGPQQNNDSDTYRLGFGVDHRFTARLTGTLDLRFAYIDIENEPVAHTYTPRPGLVYDVTPTLRASVSAGPSWVDSDGDREVRPAVSAGLVQAFKFGSLRIRYDRGVTAGTHHLEELQSFSTILIVDTFLRGLQFSFTPRYTITDRILADNEREKKVLSLNLRAIYQIARNISVIGSYTFFKQTGDRRDDDIDQNRVFLGVQYAFPINFY
jgi:hypothetical protein